MYDHYGDCKISNLYSGSYIDVDCTVFWGYYNTGVSDRVMFSTTVLLLYNRNRVSVVFNRLDQTSTTRFYP